MRIAVDTRFFESAKMPDARDFTREVFGRLAAQHPEHEFIFFVDSALSEAIKFPENVAIRIISPKPANIFLTRWWYDVKVTIALGQHKVDGFVGTYGFCSLVTQCPQVLIIRDLLFSKKPVFFGYRSYKFYKRFTGYSIKKARALVALSDFVKDELAARYHVNKSAVQTIGSGVNDCYKPVGWDERESIKEQFAQGCEYFVFTGGLHPRGNFLNMLKAFSLFKKWQKSNMKLLVVGSFDHAFEKDLEKLNTYKYRHDVVIKGNANDTEMAQIIAASYALIFPSFYEGFATPVLAALQCEVPVITSAKSSMSEIAGDAALYADPGKPQEIADQMKLIFKDERLRNSLTEASKRRAKLFSWDKTAVLLWKVIEETLSR